MLEQIPPAGGSAEHRKTVRQRDGEELRIDWNEGGGLSLEQQGVGLHVGMKPLAEPAQVLQHPVEWPSPFHSPTISSGTTVRANGTNLSLGLATPPVTGFPPSPTLIPLRLTAYGFDKPWSAVEMSLGPNGSGRLDRLQFSMR